jgi:hypothetical protein
MIALGYLLLQLGYLLLKPKDNLCMAENIMPELRRQRTARHWPDCATIGLRSSPIPRPVPFTLQLVQAQI